MKIINYISISAIPIIILIIIGNGFFEKNKLFDNFIDGVVEGIKIIYNLFPTLLGLFVAVGMFRTSGLLDYIINIFVPIIVKLNIPKEIMPLAILRPISGGTSLAIATNIIENYGVDTKIGKLASVIMGATETTLYTIAVYTSCINIKKNRGILFAALSADLVSIIISIIICNYF